MAHGLEAEYKYSVFSRTPNQSAAPTLTELEEIVPVGSMSYSDELSFDGEASLSVEPNNIPEDIAVRLKDLRAFPCELSVIRNDARIWQGPILSCQMQGPTLTINARGLAYYMRYMTLESDVLFIGTDEFTIGKGLIDEYQGYDYGNYGLTTSGIGTSGFTRTKRYFFKENQNVFNRLVQLAEEDDGFDFWVTPDRVVHFDKEKGDDKTEEVYADESNVIDPNVFWSVAADNIASEAIAAGQDASGNQQTVIGVAENTTVRESWGRATVFATGEDVTQQATIDNTAERMLLQRNEIFFVPGPEVLPVKDVEPDTFGPGDLIQYSVKLGNLGLINLPRRVRRRRVVVDQDGGESIQVELL